MCIYWFHLIFLRFVSETTFAWKETRQKQGRRDRRRGRLRPPRRSEQKSRGRRLLFPSDIHVNSREDRITFYGSFNAEGNASREPHRLNMEHAGVVSRRNVPAGAAAFTCERIPKSSSLPSYSSCCITRADTPGRERETLLNCSRRSPISCWRTLQHLRRGGK